MRLRDSVVMGSVVAASSECARQAHASGSSLTTRYTRYTRYATPDHLLLLLTYTDYSRLTTHDLPGALPAAANRPGRAHAARLQRACGGAGARRAYGSAPETVCAGLKAAQAEREGSDELSLTPSSCSPTRVTLVTRETPARAG